MCVVIVIASHCIFKPVDLPLKEDVLLCGAHPMCLLRGCFFFAGVAAKLSLCSSEVTVCPSESYCISEVDLWMSNSVAVVSQCVLVLLGCPAFVHMELLAQHQLEGSS